MEAFGLMDADFKLAKTMEPINGDIESIWSCSHLNHRIKEKRLRLCPVFRLSTSHAVQKWEV